MTSVRFSAHSADRRFPLLDSVKLAVNANDWRRLDALIDVTLQVCSASELLD